MNRAPDAHRFAASDGAEIFYRRWASVAGERKGVVQIAHGAAEHSGRYEHFAGFLNANGYLAYASDHRGHGATRVRSGALGDAGSDAWNRFVGDARELTRLIRRDAAGLPLVLFGHSMGSFIAQDYMGRQGTAVDGVVLCATTGVFNPPQEVVHAFDQAARRDPLAPSKAFSDRWAMYNQEFTPGRPGFDWLSRDAAQVRTYIEDPLCGFPFSNELARDFIKGLHAIFQSGRESAIPRDLPVLVIAGDKDPVGGNTQSIEPLLARYQEYGLTRVSVKFYAGARHELLNETNRDDVERDILHWLDAVR